MLAQPKAKVVAVLVKFKAVPRVFAKCAWLATCHNHFCGAVEDLPGFSERVRIDTALAVVPIGPLELK